MMNISVFKADNQTIQGYQKTPLSGRRLKYAETLKMLSKMRYKSLLIVLLMLLTAGLYANTLSVPFILDDADSIASNSHIRLKNLSIVNLVHAAFDSPLHRRPVANISFALNYYVGGYSLVGFHLVNILIHLITGFLLFHLVLMTLALCSYRSQTAFWLAFATAAIWLVHPLQIQSVTYIVQRMNSLAAMFYLLSLVLYIRGRTWQRQGVTSSDRARFGHLWFSGSIAAGAMALGTKEIAATLPFFIFLYEWYFFQNLSVRWLRKHLWIILGVFIALGFIALLYLGDNPLGRIINGYGRRDFTMEQRLLTQFRVVVFYFGLLLFPHPSRLNLDHDFPISNSILDPVTTLMALIFLINLLALSVVFARSERLLSFCVLWLLGNLVIESSVIGLEMVFEHRMYLPSMMGVLIAVVLVHRYIRQKWAVIVLLCAVMTVFSVWTFQRNRLWQDEITLLTDSVKKSPRKVRPLYNLGVAWAEKGDSEKAIGYYQKALSINPNLASIHTNLAIELYQVGDVTNAFKHYHKALEIKPNFVFAHIKVGVAYSKQGHTDKAIYHLEEALHIDPDSLQAHQHMGKIMLQLNRPADAVFHYRRVLKLNPNHAESYNNLGIAFIMLGKRDEAIVVLKQAVRLKPDFREARLNLDRALMRRTDE